MQDPHYALVAYVRSSLGIWVENLRRELHPPHGHLPAHITVLPPRCLQGTEAQAVELVERVCQDINPFEVVLGNVEHFIPVTPTVFIRVAHAAYRLRELHDKLNLDSLAAEERWPYMPHLTIAKLDSEDDARQAVDIATQRWAEFPESRTVKIEELTFVRQGQNNTWIDLAPVPLGRRLAPTR